MVLDHPDTRRAAPRPHPGSSLQIFRSLPLSPGRPPAAAKALPSFAPAPAPPVFHRLLLNNATPPKSAPLPERISRSTASGIRREDTAPPQQKNRRNGLPLH